MRMGVLLLIVVITLAVEVRAHDEPTLPVCGYNCTAGANESLSCWVQGDIENGHSCEGAPSTCECQRGFNSTKDNGCGQLCVDINECENPMQCGIGLNSSAQCINTIGGCLRIDFPDVGREENSTECRSGDITLLRGSSLSEGLLAMCFEGEWILPCSDDWTDLEASVACQQLGFQWQPGELRIQPQNDVYSDKVFRCNGDEASLEECGTDPEFSGVCHHVNLSCYNPNPLSPIEVCLPVNNRNNFMAALAERVSENCSCIYTKNEIRFRGVTVSCPDGENLFKLGIGNYRILPDGIVQRHIEELSSVYGILDQCPEELQANCSTPGTSEPDVTVTPSQPDVTVSSSESDVPLVAILVPIIAAISLLLVAGVVVVVMIRKRRAKRILQPQDETKTSLDNPSYHVTVLPHLDDKIYLEPERIVMNTSPVAHTDNETFLVHVDPNRYEQPQFRQTPPTVNSQAEYAEIDEQPQLPQTPPTMKSQAKYAEIDEQPQLPQTPATMNSQAEYAEIDEQPQLGQAPPTMKSQAEYAEIDDQPQLPQTPPTMKSQAKYAEIDEQPQLPQTPATMNSQAEYAEIDEQPQLGQAPPTMKSQAEYAEIDDQPQLPQPYQVPVVPADDTTIPEGIDQGAYAVLNQQGTQYAMLEPAASMEPQGSEADKHGYSHLQH